MLTKLFFIVGIAVLAVSVEPSSDPCALPIAPGMCNGYNPSYGFDAKKGVCVKFNFGGCGGNANRFKTSEECAQACVEAQVDPCALPIVPGMCRGFMPSYGYDAKKQICVKFIYGGCGGNQNRFKTEEECLQACSLQNVGI